MALKSCLKRVFLMSIVWSVLVVLVKVSQLHWFELQVTKHSRSNSTTQESFIRNRWTTTSDGITSEANIAKPESLNLTAEFIQELYFDEDNVNSTQELLSLTEKGIQAFETLKRNSPNLWFERNDFYKRRKSMRNRCSENHVDNRIDLSRMVYDDTHKVVMCVVPKDACTAWKSVMWYLRREVSQQNMWKINSNELMLEPLGSTKTLKSLPTTEAIAKLLTYTTFLITRHPFERLVSAHSSKFTDRNHDNIFYKQQYGKDIASQFAEEHFRDVKFEKSGSNYSVIENEAFLNMTKHDQDAALNYAARINTGNITFEQFAKFITHFEQDIYDHDVHWRPQVTLCNPCVLNYDYVIRFENLVEDSNTLLNFLQRNDAEEDRISFKDKKPALIGSSKTANAFSAFAPEFIEKLGSVYKHDFAVLNYSINIY